MIKDLKALELINGNFGTNKIIVGKVVSCPDGKDRVVTRIQRTPDLHRWLVQTEDTAMIVDSDNVIEQLL